MTSDLPVFDSIDKKFLLQKQLNTTEYENDISVLEFPNHVYKTNDLALIKFLWQSKWPATRFNTKNHVTEHATATDGAQRIMSYKTNDLVLIEVLVA